MSHLRFAEYLWIDGAKPSQQIRSKARIIKLPNNPQSSDFPHWNFDGSSTGQAEGSQSDCSLIPVRVYQDPFRGEGNYLVLCEVYDSEGKAHESNQRARLRNIVENANSNLEAWLGFEQEYTLFRDGRPLGFPVNSLPPPQGPYYCGVGTENSHGRALAEEHARACITAGVLFYGINAEVMPGQWEFQIGYRGIADEQCDALSVADDVWLARYLLNRVGEKHGIRVSLDNKPFKGDWNGAGMHTNFSTSQTRNKQSGMSAIKTIIDTLGSLHSEHIMQYGDRLDERLTGEHETCEINSFKSGVAHRGASIRIPQSVAELGFGYLEDRRPGANADPYCVGKCLIEAADGSESIISKTYAA